MIDDEIDDELDRRGEQLRTQAPVVLTDGGLILDEPGALAWVEGRLHDPGALVVVHLAHRRGPDDDPHELVALSRWYPEDEVDVEVEFVVDGEAAGHGPQTRPGVDTTRPGRPVRLLHHGGASSGGRSDDSWWLPRHPERELVVRLRWVDGSRGDEVRLDTTAWPALAATRVRRLRAR